MAAGISPLHRGSGDVEFVLSGFITALQEHCGPALVSVVLFGSAADNKLTAQSDVNVLVVLRTFDPAAMAQIRDQYLVAEAAIALRAMFVLESELPSAAELFGQKFADIRRRHRIIFGQDVIANLDVPRTARIFRLRQVLLNLVLRLREAYMSRAQQPEQVIRVLADALGPMRAAAATLLELEGVAKPEADAALRSVAASCGPQHEAAAAQLFAAHDGEFHAAQPDSALFSVTELVACMLQRAERLT